MRDALDAALAELAARRDDVVLITADLGSFRRFRAVAPDRFINVGVAEALSVSVAAGLASEGRHVFVYSVAGFTLHRGFEQLKYAVGYWRQDVTLVATGFGWRYNLIGRGHRTPDDIALARLVPYLSVYAPATEEMLGALVAADTRHPRFIRLGEGLGPVAAPPEEGTVVVCALGDCYVRMCPPVWAAREAGWDVGLLAVCALDDPKLDRLVEAGVSLVVVEDHGRAGGIGELLAGRGGAVVAHRHLPVDVDVIAATEAELLSHHGFSIEQLTAWLADALAGTAPAGRARTCALRGGVA